MLLPALLETTGPTKALETELVLTVNLPLVAEMLPPALASNPLLPALGLTAVSLLVMLSLEPAPLAFSNGPAPPP